MFLLLDHKFRKSFSDVIIAGKFSIDQIGLDKNGWGEIVLVFRTIGQCRFGKCHFQQFFVEVLKLVYASFS